ncbi:MAG: hypothetical protein K1X64_02700 [Myxococcaceae bacterium]|nr:hypothetical protein [Myxococcaceae bacterium]
MIEALVNQFLQSGAGADVMNQLKSHGLEAPQAQAAVQATAEGAAQQLGGAGGGGLGELAAGLLGGASGGGGLGGLAAGLMGGASTTAASAGNLAALAGPIAQFVAQKTGLAPAIASTVVNVALPKLLEMMKGAGGAALPPASSGIAGMMGGLLKQ